MPGPLLAAATTGSHKDVPGAPLSPQSLFRALCWGNPANWSPFDWKWELISWSEPHFFLDCSHLTYPAEHRHRGSVWTEKRTAMSFGDVPRKTVFAAKVLGPAQGQDCMGQGLRRDVKVLSVQDIVKVSRNVAFDKSKWRKTIPTIQKTYTV